jgi:hypothetical protein
MTVVPAPGAEPRTTEARAVLAPNLWLDPDVRWLTGTHEAGGHAYLVREPYEELLWWMQMPSLLRLAGEPVLDRAAITRMGASVDAALATGEAAGYRIDALTGTAELAAPEEEAPEPESDSLTVVEPEPEGPSVRREQGHSCP